MVRSAPKSCDSCTNSFCQSLSPESRAKIFKMCRWVNYPYKKEQIVFFGNGNLLILESGALMTIRSTPEGKKQGIDILKAGDLLGIVQLFNKEYEDTISVLPLSSVCGCMLPIEGIEQLIRENHDISNAIIAHLSRRFVRVIHHLSVHSFGTSKDKLDYALYKTTNDRDIKHLTHEELAILSGLNRVTVTRTIREINDYQVEDINKFF